MPKQVSQSSLDEGVESSGQLLPLTWRTELEVNTTRVYGPCDTEACATIGVCSVLLGQFYMVMAHFLSIPVPEIKSEFSHHTTTAQQAREY